MSKESNKFANQLEINEIRIKDKAIEAAKI